MEKKTSISNPADKEVIGLETSFVTKNESAALMKMLDLALDDLDQVSGGMMSQEVCQCINCCSSH
jgi:hypothetical protein